MEALKAFFMSWAVRMGLNIEKINPSYEYNAGTRNLKVTFSLPGSIIQVSVTNSKPEIDDSELEIDATEYQEYWKLVTVHRDEPKRGESHG